MPKQPLFSIIIPTYNRAAKLRRSLESVEKQALRDFEVIVCDDGSTDDTKAVVEAFAKRMRVEYIREENWGGPARPRNNGIRAARGEWLCFLDADDWWYPDKLESVARHLHEGDIIYHDLDVYPKKISRIKRKVRGRRLRRHAFVDLMLRGNCIANSSVTVRKAMVERAGGVTEDGLLEDFDLWLKIARLTDRFLYIPRSLGAYWWGEDNISDVSERLIESTKALYARHRAYLSTDDQRESDLFMTYTIARIEQRLGLFDGALSHFKSAIRIKSLQFKLQSMIMMAAIYCRGILPDRIARL